MADEQWLTSLREQKYAEALARARFEAVPPDVTEALTELATVERTIKEKRYASAKRALQRYQETLTVIDEPAILRSAVDDHALGRALAALDETEQARVKDVGVLREQLAPAFAHPLTEAEAHNAVGVLLAVQGEVDAARAAFERALNADPRHYRAQTNIGNLLLEEGAAAEAEIHYRRALEENPDFPGAHHNLAVALRRQKKLAASVRSLKTGQRLLARQSNRDSRDEARERFSRAGVDIAKWLRWILIAIALVIAWYFLQGGA